jgi:hypothetical protein
MSRQQLMTLVNSPTRLGSLSTSDNLGNINAAVVGSARMPAETMILGLGDNRTLHNSGTIPRRLSGLRTRRLPRMAGRTPLLGSPCNRR